MVRANRLGLRLGEIYPELGTAQPATCCRPQPLDTTRLRHTVGLADALTPTDIAIEDRVTDGLPQDLEASIRAYGCAISRSRCSADPERDFPRLRRIVALLEHETSGQWHVTLDGNENFHDFAAFRSYWETARAGLRCPALVRACSSSSSRCTAIMRCQTTMGTSSAPGRIGRRSSSTSRTGRSATSRARSRSAMQAPVTRTARASSRGSPTRPVLRLGHGAGRAAVLTGEDLANLGPVALLQDLAMMALLGISHVERNGHHYYRGLSMLPADVAGGGARGARRSLSPHEDGFACAAHRGWPLDLRSVNAAPFGVAPVLDPSVFQRFQAVAG